MSAIADDDVDYFCVGPCWTTPTKPGRAAAGCSPNAFIRTLRLRRAAQLLTESQMTVTEITYAVGFSDLKHFRTIFREYYGVAPGEYLKHSKTK